MDVKEFFYGKNHSISLLNALKNIKKNYLNYDLRDKYIIEAIYWAMKCDLKVGMSEGKVAIDLPVGQVSWYMQDITFDHHSNDIKDKRMNEFISKLDYLFNEAFSG